jgi:hypothetical protein
VSHPDGPPSPALNTRIAMAEEDLTAAERVDLATASKTELIVLIAKITGSLSDMIRLHRERDAG